MTARIMYLRDASYRPVGCLAISVDHRKNRAEYAYSVLNPMDHFDRKVARQLALGRLVEVPVTVRIPVNASMHDISEAVMADLCLADKAPARARKAAKLWLRYSGL